MTLHTPASPQNIVLVMRRADKRNGAAGFIMSLRARLKVSLLHHALNVTPLLCINSSIRMSQGPGLRPPQTPLNAFQEPLTPACSHSPAGPSRPRHESP